MAHFCSSEIPQGGAWMKEREEVKVGGKRREEGRMPEQTLPYKERTCASDLKLNSNICVPVTSLIQFQGICFPGGIISSKSFLQAESFYLR